MLRVGIAHHFGWAVAVTTSADHRVVDRRRLDLIEPGIPVAPIHNESKHLDDAALAALVATVRASVARATAAALDDLIVTLDGPVTAMSLRGWPHDFPSDITVLRKVPYEARADSVMYRQILADDARTRGWTVTWYDAKTVENAATRLLGSRAEEVLRGQRSWLGPPWTKDHRMALAATVVGSHASTA